MNASDQIDTGRVRAYLLELQDRICGAVETEDGKAAFIEDQRAVRVAEILIDKTRILDDYVVIIPWSIADETLQ